MNMDTKAKRIEKAARELLHSLIRYEVENILCLSGNESEDVICNNDIKLETDEFSTRIVASVEVDESYLDVHETVHEKQAVKLVWFLNDGTPAFTVAPQDDDSFENDVTANQLAIDELIAIADALEIERAKLL